MADLALKLNPLSQLKIYRAAKSIVLRKMDGKKMTPKRALKIIRYLKRNVVKLKTAQMAKEFYLYVSKLFPELRELRKHFDTVEREKQDKLLGLMVDRIMKNSDIEKASSVMDRIEEAKSKESITNLISELESEFPAEFRDALKNVAT